MTRDEINAQVASRHKHARKCKKTFGECQTCEDNMKWFKQLELEDLSIALDDRTGVK